jgi:2-amino-4-hydroxy-6-hydroxymethyldihydropteridine diphosphokinase
VAIALGANLGDPAATLVAVRPRLERLLASWWAEAGMGASEEGSGQTAGESSGEASAPPPCRWSPLFRTEPVGGPAGQPPYLNAVVLAAPPLHAAGALPDPLPLLGGLQALEAGFGRRRRQRWGPRSLDLDLLWCGDRCRHDELLLLPHPRLAERSFVLAPLAAIDPQLPLPEVLVGAGPRRCGERLAALLPVLRQQAPLRLPPRPGWPE